MSGPRSNSSPDERPVQSRSSVSRRTVLGTTGAVVATGLAGCAVEARQQQPPTPLVDTTLRAEPGQYDTIEFRLDDEQWTTVAAYLSDRSVDVKLDGPAVDVVVMTPDQYTRFQETRAFDYVGGVSMPDVVTGEVSAMLDAGDYVLLVDNTATGAAAPGSASVPAVVSLEVTTSETRN